MQWRRRGQRHYHRESAVNKNVMDLVDVLGFGKCFGIWDLGFGRCFGIW